MTGLNGCTVKCPSQIAPTSRTGIGGERLMSLTKLYVEVVHKKAMSCSVHQPNISRGPNLGLEIRATNI